MTERMQPVGCFRRSNLWFSWGNSRDIASGKRETKNYGKSLFSMGKSGKSTISISMAMASSSQTVTVIIPGRVQIDIPSPERLYF